MQQSKKPRARSEAKLSIGALSQATAIPVATLRTWEHRYGFPVAERKPSGQRLYPLSSVVRIFDTDRDQGEDGTLADAPLSWAHRPPGHRWSVLDRLRLQHESRSGDATPGITPRRIVYHLALNRISGPGAGASTVQRTSRERGSGERLPRPRIRRAPVMTEKSGARVPSSRSTTAPSTRSRASTNSTSAGFTDHTRFEARYELSPRFDVGMQAGLLHRWKSRTLQGPFGPSVGVSPLSNAWLTLGYDLRGFRDADFESAEAAAQGPYLRLRCKFDQQTFRPWGAGR